MVNSTLAQLVESLTLKLDFAGYPSLSLLFFMQIIFLNLSYLLLLYISEVFEIMHVFSFFLPVVEIADNGCIW